jgi:hypothetical protein
MIGKVIGVGDWLETELPEVGAILCDDGVITVGERLIVDVEVVNTMFGEESIEVDVVVEAKGVVVAEGVIAAEGVVVEEGVVMIDRVVVVDGVICCTEAVLVEVVKVDNADECDGEVEVVVVVGIPRLGLEELAIEFKLA